MVALCSSSLLRAKLRDEAIKMRRSPPSFKTTTPSLTSFMGTNSWVDFEFWAVWLAILGSIKYKVLSIKKGRN